MSWTKGCKEAKEELAEREGKSLSLHSQDLAEVLLERQGGNQGRGFAAGSWEQPGPDVLQACAKAE